MKRSWIVCGVLACLSASALLAKPGIVKTRDGRTLEGDVAEKGDGVTVTIRGIPSTISRDNLESVTYTGTIEEQYKKKLEALPKTPTAKDHLDIARFLFDAKAYELARKEADAALAIDPNNTDANTLYTTIQSQLRLDHNKPAVASGTPAAPPRVKTPVKPAVAAGENPPRTASLHKYLSPEEMNNLKQAEWTQEDTTVKLSLTADVRRKYIASAQENAASFNALPATEQARKILANGTAEERKEIRIANDPAVLMEYKRVIQPMVLNNCASTGCHGGPAGGKLFLYGTPDGDAATYTNFYLLMTTRANVGGAERMVIDRTYPEKSLLVEFGLPSEISKVSHPEVKGSTWRSVFRSKEDPQYKTLMKWMGKLITPDPKYDFSFSLEGDAKPDAPAPKPAVK